MKAIAEAWRDPAAHGERPHDLRAAALLYGVYVNGIVALWATSRPAASTKLPRLRPVWVAVDGPYNQHLVRDVGTLALGLTIVLVAAAWTLSRPLLITAAAAMTAAALPHTLYHLRHAGVFETTGDKVVSLGGLVLGTVLGIVLLLVVVRPSSTSELASARPAAAGHAGEDG